MKDKGKNYIKGWMKALFTDPSLDTKGILTEQKKI